jgi:predicted RNA-binding Zn-ribbon protein involved in translation (DUF1610 family)
MGAMGTYIFIAVLVVVLAVLVRWLARTAQAGFFECKFCGEQATEGARLSPRDRRHLAGYFQHVEGRTPAIDHMRACSSCRKVDDDRSSAMTAEGLSLRCKSCDIAVYLKDSMKCPNCGATYAWKSFGEYGNYCFLAVVSCDESSD